MVDHPTAHCEHGIAKEEAELLKIIPADVSGTRTNQWYTEYASLYEQSKQFYYFQKECLKSFKEYVTKRDCSIIDFAMGTGVMGDLLKDAGFTGPIDGVDRNIAMMDIAKTKKVYTNVWNTNIGLEKISFVNDDTYDHGVAAGCLGRGHIPIAALPTMIRTIKKGGYLVCTLSQHQQQFEECTVDALKDHCNKWERDGLCHLVSCVQGRFSMQVDCHVIVLQRGSKQHPNGV